MASLDDVAWARSITSDADLGDVRRNVRASRVLLALLDNPGASLSGAAGGRSAALEQYYRHARADAVSPDELLKSGFSAVASDIRYARRGQSDIALIGDTTTLSYRHAVAAHLGPMSSVKKSVNRGWIVHTVLAVEAETGETIGPLEQLWWSRDECEHGKAKARNQRPYDTRESYKWECSANAALERLGEAAGRTIFVTDRESDVFEYLSDSVGWGRRFVVRCGRNRCVEDRHSYLMEQCEAQPVLTTLRLRISQKGSRKAREATLRIQATHVTVLPPQDIQTHQPKINLNVLTISEISAPPDSTPIQWLLLTTEPIENPEAALRVVKLYALRWRVEEFHKFWKSDGMRVENLRMATPDNLRRVAVLMAFAACRLMRLRDAVVPPTCHLTTMSGERDAAAVPTQPDMPCTDLLTDKQWRILWGLTANTAPPESPPSRRWASLAVARLGRWTDTKHTGRPGYKAYVDGWKQLMQACETLEIATKLALVPPSIGME